MKRTTIALILLTLANICFKTAEAQVSPSKQFVISTAGQTDTTDDQKYIIDWNIGEPLIESLEGSKKRITQGFLQANFVGSSYVFSPLDNDDFFKFNIYPNPFRDKLTVNWNFSLNTTFLFELFDVNGKRIYAQYKASLDLQADFFFPGLTKGIYILRISESKNNLYKSYTLIKN